MTIRVVLLLYLFNIDREFGTHTDIVSMYTIRVPSNVCKWNFVLTFNIFKAIDYIIYKNYFFPNINLIFQNEWTFSIDIFRKI